MSSAASNLVNKVWNYCNLLRDDGVSYGDYVEQLTYLLFLKMDYERTRPPYNKKSSIPVDYNWATRMELDGIPLEKHYRDILENLGKEPGILGIIFRKAQNKIQNPAQLRRLIKANLDIFWLRDESLGDSSDLPDPAVLAAEIVEDLQAALDQFAQIASDLGAPDRATGRN